MPQKTDVGVIAFQQPWNTIARECEEMFAPEGIAYVEVSPPQETIQGSQWWTSYQPVSYDLDSKLGTAQEFQSMIDTCRSLGVNVIADVVFNQSTYSTDDDTTQYGVAGTPFNPAKGRYPGFTDEEGKHQDGLNAQDFHNYADGQEIKDYANQEEVQQGRLGSMWDLDSESEKVQDIQADYLVKLYTMGIRGFRMDASKHMHTDSLHGIKEKMAQRIGKDVDDIYWIQEVIATQDEAEGIQPRHYFQNGTVTQFGFLGEVKEKFTSDIRGLQGLSDRLNETIPSEYASVFVANWDSERDGTSLSYKDGVIFELANGFMLAYDYGKPRILSDYKFDDPEDGAPYASDTSVPDLDMAQEFENPESNWNCEQRWNSIRGMIRFHNAVAGTCVERWQEGSDNVIAFDRGDRGFFAINNSNEPVDIHFTTALPDGIYNNWYTSLDNSWTQEVRDGIVQTQLPAKCAIAIYRDDEDN